MQEICNQKRYKINKLAPHPGPHLGEALSAVILRRFGGDKFPGIEGAVVEPKKLTCSEEECLREGVLPLGQCRGRYDDKDANGARINGTCCALRTAKEHGVEKRPELARILKAVNRIDNTPTSGPSELGTLMKCAIDGVPAGAHGAMFGWAERAVVAIIDCESRGGGTRCKNFVKPAAVFERMIEDGCAEDSRVIDRMRRILADSESRVENCIEVSHVMRAMKVVGVPDEEATEWLYTGLLKTVEQQEQYLNALDEIKVKGREFEISPRYHGDAIRLVLIASDNPQVSRASRAPEFRYAVCIVRRKSGNVAVIPNSWNSLDMRAVRALIRIEETPPELRANVRFEEYSQEGSVLSAPNWYMMKDGILNGSNHISAEPTRLTDEVLVEIVQCGFTEEALPRFSRLRGGSGELSAGETAYLESIRKSGHDRKPTANQNRRAGQSATLANVSAAPVSASYRELSRMFATV